MPRSTPNPRRTPRGRRPEPIPITLDTACRACGINELRRTVDCSMVEKALTATGPVRTCIGCRQRAAAADLMRVAVATEQGASIVTIDRTSTMPGRGAWLHRDPDCLRVAVKRRAFGPALRVPGLVVDAADLEREMTATAHQGSGA